MSGKGSDRRPQQVSEEVAQANWERIFGKPAEPNNQEPEPADNGEQQ